MLIDLEVDHKHYMVENDFKIYYQEIVFNDDLDDTLEQSFYEGAKDNLISYRESALKRTLSEIELNNFILLVLYWSSLKFFKTTWYHIPYLNFTNTFFAYMSSISPHLKNLIDDWGYLPRFETSINDDESDWRYLPKQDAEVLYGTFYIEPESSESTKLQAKYYKEMLQMVINGEAIVIVFYLA